MFYVSPLLAVPAIAVFLSIGAELARVWLQQAFTHLCVYIRVSILKGLLRQSQAVMLYTQYIFIMRAWPDIDSWFIKPKATAVYQFSKPKSLSVAYFSVYLCYLFFFFFSCWNVHTFRGFLAGALCCISRVCCHGNRRSTNGSRKSWRRSGKKHRGRWQRRRGSTMKRCVCVCAYAHK